MIKKIILTIIVSIFIISSPLFARNLSLDDAVGEAVNKSAQVLSNALEIENATIDDENKYASIYPTLSVSGTAYKANDSVYATVTPSLYLSTTLSASFAFNPAMITSLQTTSLSLKNKIISFDKAKKDVELQIKKIYYRILVQEAALDLQKENIDYLQQTLENTQAAYENGDIPEINVLQLKAQISSQVANYEKTQTTIVSQKRTLAFLIGLDDITEDLNLTDTLPTTYDDDLSKYTLEKAFAASPDLQSSQINRQMLDVNKKALKESTYFPSLSLSASYNPTWEVADGAIDYYYDAGSVSATIAFNITNMLPGSSNQKSLQKLDVSYSQLEVGNTSIKDNIVLEFNSNIEAIKEAKRQIELSKESIDLSKQSFELTSLSYESGFSTFSDLQSAQLSVSNAQLSLLQAQYSYVSALLDLEDQCSI
ncbi:MAG: TolC family protein [Sphaerochaetaceae bacterium]|nr:TolC family protein [Sphaerochaetaceae bacterium]